MDVFEGWDFLVTEMAVLLGLAALVGLLAGYFLFGGRGRRKAKRLEMDLETCRQAGLRQAADITALEKKIAWLEKKSGSTGP